MPAPSVARCGNYVVRTRPTGRTLVVFLSLTGCLRDAAGRRRSGRRPAAPGSAPAQVRRVRGLPADRLRQVFGLPRHGQVRRHRTQVCCWFLFFFSAQLPSSCYILFFLHRMRLHVRVPQQAELRPAQVSQHGRPGGRRRRHRSRGSHRNGASLSNSNSYFNLVFFL